MKLTQRSRVREGRPEGCTCVSAVRSFIPPEVWQRGMQKKARGPSASLGLAGSRELGLQTRRPPETISLSPNPASLERGDLGNNLSKLVLGQPPPRRAGQRQGWAHVSAGRQMSLSLPYSSPPQHFLPATRT